MISELTRVQGQNSRARSMKAEATLTLAEWEQTIADFHEMCAYCNIRSFEVLEHFIPFGQDGEGTHVNNCLPACNQCNKLKKDSGLERVMQKFGKETIEQLQIYLIGRLHQEDTPKPLKPKPVTKAKREKRIPVAIPSDVPYLTLEQVAMGLGMSRATVYNYVKELSIRIRQFELSKRRYVAREDFEYIRAVKETPWKFPELIKTR